VIILGLNAFHGDSAAALVRDGVLVAAAEEERFRRVRHWAGFPSHAIAYCLSQAKLTLAEIDHVAVNQHSRANWLRKVGYPVTSPPSLALLRDRLGNRGRRAAIPELLAKEVFPPAFCRQSHRASPRPPVIGFSCLADCAHVRRNALQYGLAAVVVAEPAVAAEVDRVAARDRTRIRAHPSWDSTNCCGSSVISVESFRSASHNSRSPPAFRAVP